MGQIVQERLEREYDLDLIVTAPSVVYKVHMNDGSIVDCDSPAKLCDVTERKKVTEPYVAMEIFCPQEYSGALMELSQKRRGEYKDMKSRSKGYASMEYAVIDYRENDLVRLDILIAGENAAPLAAIVHRDASFNLGKGMTRKLKELIP